MANTPKKPAAKKSTRAKSASTKASTKNLYAGSGDVTEIPAPSQGTVGASGAAQTPVANTPAPEAAVPPAVDATAALLAQNAQLMAMLAEQSRTTNALLEKMAAGQAAQQERQEEDEAKLIVRNLRPQPTSLSLRDPQYRKPYRVELAPRGKRNDFVSIPTKFRTNDRLTAMLQGGHVEIITETEANSIQYQVPTVPQYEQPENNLVGGTQAFRMHEGAPPAPRDAVGIAGNPVETNQFARVRAHEALMQDNLNRKLMTPDPQDPEAWVMRPLPVDLSPGRVERVQQ